MTRHGTLDQSRAGANADLSGLTYKLENGAPANILGGLGSGLAYASGNTFLALPDRGPNAATFNSAIDNTVSYINRFHAITMDLEPNTSGSGLPFTLTPKLRNTTLLCSWSPLVYGTGSGLGVGSGVPRSIIFCSTSSPDAPTTSIPAQLRRSPRCPLRHRRHSCLQRWVACLHFRRVRPLHLRVRPPHRRPPPLLQAARFLFVSNLRPVGSDEIAANTSGRTANKGMEGLAITPDGRTLVGIMQAALIQDAALGGDAAKLLRIVTIDILSGHTHEYAYLLTTGSGVSEITAINNHEFLVDERDGKGRGDNSTKPRSNRSSRSI